MVEESAAWLDVPNAQTLITLNDIYEHLIEYP